MTQRGRSPISLKSLIEEGLLAERQELRLRDNVGHTALLTRDGRLLVGNRSFNSPSAAASAILGVNTNGWIAWKALRDEKWLSLDAIRKEATA